jgi:hypothetical protein
MSTFKHTKKDIEKWMVKVHEQVKDVDFQIEVCQQLHTLCKDEASTTIIVQGGAIKALTAAMEKHEEHDEVQREATVVLHRLIERGGVPAAKAALTAGVIDRLCIAMQQHPHMTSIHSAVASVFRQLVAKCGENAAKAADSAGALEDLTNIRPRNDENAKYQLSKAIAAIKKALPPPKVSSAHEDAVSESEASEG